MFGRMRRRCLRVVVWRRAKQRQKTTRKQPPLTRSGKVRQGRERVRSAEGPVPGGRAVAKRWEWLERPTRRGMVWDGMQPPAMGKAGYSHAFWGLASIRWSTAVLTSIQYRMWPVVQCNHAPHVDLDGGGGCMLSVSRCLLVKRQRRPRRNGLICVVESTSVTLRGGYRLLYRKLVY